LLINIFAKSQPGSAAERKIIAWGAAIAAVLLVVDQITKILVERNFALGEHIQIIPGFFDLTYVTNKGAAWGILHGYGWLLLAIAIAVILVAVSTMRWLTEGWNERYLALFIVISGIIGNSIDRIWRGEVVDFLDFYVNGWHWPAFNIADSAICVGVCVYFLSTLLRKSDSKNTAKDKIQSDPA
jgi:signal peptidase II